MIEVDVEAETNFEINEGELSELALYIAIIEKEVVKIYIIIRWNIIFININAVIIDFQRFY